MSRIKRRHFLQSTGAALAALGLSQYDIFHQANKYGSVLAQGTNRKLALLVGINEYSSDMYPLQGCVNDVDMQRQLLINRFGFHPKDILTLTDSQATRQGILTGFEEHLIKQAKPGDVVVFHFSGHGGQVEDPDKDNPNGLNSTLVPMDSGYSSSNSEVQEDIMGHTLFLLMYALQTENVTAILDACHSGGGFRGNYVVRTATDSRGKMSEITPAEYEYQRQWLSKLNLSREEFIKRRRKGIAKGVGIASGKDKQLAVDAYIDDKTFGAFTYALTQYLWQQTTSEPLSNVMVNVARSVSVFSDRKGYNQKPIFEVKPGSSYAQSPIYFIEQQMPPAEAVILGVEGDRAQVWIGGVHPQNITAFGRGAVLNIIDSEGKPQGEVELESRNGLEAKGKLQGNAKRGSLLQEKMRVIAHDISLTIGLDPSLGKDTQAAKQALETIKRLEAIPLHKKEVQYILGRMTNAYYKDFQNKKIAKIPPINSIGLFSPSLEIIPGSFDAVGESAKQAIKRLQPKFKSLLAVYLVKLTLNVDSSKLDVGASMKREDGSELLAQTFTVRVNKTLTRGVGKGSVGDRPTPKMPSDIKKLPLGTAVKFEITNNENYDLYFTILMIEPTGEMHVIFPNQWATTDEVMRVKARQKLLVPEPNNSSFSLVTQEPLGVAEALIIASTKPLRNALLAMQTIALRGGNSRGPITPDEPIEVVDNLLEDLSESNRNKGGLMVADYKVKRINTNQMAAMSITFEVI
ncbi:MAG: caspase family protein [Cyanobacteria bacterium J06635_10]